MKNLLISVSVWCGGMCVAGCFVLGERIEGESLCRSGFEQIDAGAYEQARGSFQAALQEHPRYAGALYGLASVLEEEGIPGDANLEEDEEDDWSDEEESEELDPAYREHLTRTLAYYDQAIESDPKFAFAYLSRSIVKDGLGDEPGGEADYQQAVQLDKSLGAGVGGGGHLTVIDGRRAKFDPCSHAGASS